MFSIEKVFSSSEMHAVSWHKFLILILDTFCIVEQGEKNSEDFDF